MNLSILILILSVIIASFAQILLKKSAAKTYSSPIKQASKEHLSMASVSAPAF